jgi:uncharacterized membrane protein YjjP (DUF1212 family)
MTKAILYGVLGFFAGFATFFAGFMLTELFSYFAHPFPANFKMEDQQALFAHIVSYPPWVLGVAVGLWGSTVMAASWVGTRIGGRVAGIVLCLVLVFLFYCNLMQFPYPFWFKAAEFVSLPICLYIGYMMARGMTPSAKGAKLAPV